MELAKVEKQFPVNQNITVMKKCSIIFLFMFMASFLYGQIEAHDIDIIKEIALEEQEIIEALVLYPKEIRESIFEATTHPEVVIKLANVQSRTSTKFRELMLNYPEDVQKGIWEMTRYPDLIERLVEDPQSSATIIQQYPEKIQDFSRNAVENELNLLKEIAKLKAFSESTFTRVLEPLPESTQTVFNELIEYPEILVLLNQNIELTILGGDLYKKAPDLVRYHADSLNLEVASQQAQELENWKYELENNPAAAKELKKATVDFAEEYGYEEANLIEEKEVLDDLYYDEEEYDYDDEEFQRVEHHYYHYPYWFGYPYWYSYSYWRPYPFWYECGFFWDPYGSIVIYNFPSPFFMHWYFYNPYHHYQYVYLSDHFVNHYYGHRSSGSSISGTVKNWRTTNRAVVKDDWMENESARIPALKEFGKMENSRISYNEKHPKNVMTKGEYVEKYEKKYPHLKTSVGNQTEISKDRTKTQKPVYKQRDINPKSPKTKNKTIPQKAPRREKPITRYKKAQDYHKQTWQRRTTPTTRSRTTTPRTSPPRTSPPKSRTTSKTPRKKN